MKFLKTGTKTRIPRMELMPTAFEKSLKKQIICLKMIKKALNNCLPNVKFQENNKI